MVLFFPQEAAVIGFSTKYSIQCRGLHQISVRKMDDFSGHRITLINGINSETIMRGSQAINNEWSSIIDDQ